MDGVQNPANTQQRYGATENKSGTNIYQNQFKPTGDLVLTITSNGTGYNGNVNLYLMSGLVPNNAAFRSGAKEVDGTNITLSGNDLTSTFSELKDYLKFVKMHCDKITVITSDTANFLGDSRLIMGRVKPDGTAEKAEIRFADYKRSDGNGVVSDTLVIDDQKFTTGGNFMLLLTNLKLSTSMTFRFRVAGTNDNAVITEM